MPYSKQIWTDEELADIALYDIKKPDDTPIEEDVKIEMVTDVIVAGTGVTAERMGHIEDGIEDATNTAEQAAADVSDLQAASLRAEYTNVETISTTRALIDADLPIQRLTPHGGDRAVTFPAPGSNNHLFFIINESDTYSLLMPGDWPDISPGKYALAIPNGAAWHRLATGDGVETDNTLTGDGTVGNPLGIVYPKYSTIMAIHSAGATVPASTTYYGNPYKSQIDATANQFTFPVAGKLKNMRFGAGSQPASGSLVITVQKNGADTDLSITVPAGAGSNNYADTTNNVEFAAGNQMRVKLVNNATATSASLSVISFEFEMITVGQ